MMKNPRISDWKSQWNLLYVLSRMHMRSNDYRTFLGALWSLLGPLITFSILYFVTVERFGKGVTLFSLKLLVGVLAVNFFNTVVRILMIAVRQSREVAVDCRVYSEIFILAPLIVPVTKFFVEMSLCLVVAQVMGVLKFSNVPWIFLTAIFFCFLAVGVALILGVLNFLAADVNEIWIRVESLIFLVTPVFYSVDMLGPVPQKILLWLNPVAPFVLAFQAFTSGDAVPGFNAVIAWRGIFFAAAFLTAGYCLLKKFEKQIVELV